MIKLLVGSKNHLDFEQPIEVTEVQKREFIDLLEKTFKIVEFEEVGDFTRNRLGQQKAFPCKWTNKEIYLLCLPTETTEDICLASGRSWFAIDHQRGSVNFEFSKWARETGIDITTGFTPEIVERYMKEKIQKKGEKKVREEHIRKLNEEINDLKEQIASFSGQRYHDLMELRIKSNPKETISVEEFTRKKIKEKEELIISKKKRISELDKQ